MIQKICCYKLATCLILFTSPLLLANDGFEYGIAGGLSFASIPGGQVLTVRQMDTPRRKMGLLGGIFVEWERSKNSRTVAELALINKGSNWIRPMIAFGYDGNYVVYDITYLQLTVLNAIKICGCNKSVYLVLGGYGGLTTSANDEWVFELAPAGELPDNNLRDDINGYDYGLSIGIRLPIGMTNHYLQARLDWGLPSINSGFAKRAPTDFSEKDAQKNRAIIVNLGFRL